MAVPPKPSVMPDATQEKQPFGSQPISMRPSFSKPPSSRDGNRPDPARKVPISSASDVPTSATDKDSWRSRVVPVRQPSGSQPKEDSPPTSVHVPPPLLATVDTLIIKADENLEVVDFSELGKLVGSEYSSSHLEMGAHPAPTFPQRHTRPTAIDFFDDHDTRGSSHREAAEEGSWRRKQPLVRDNVGTSEVHEPPLTSPIREKLRVQTVLSDTTRTTGDTSSAASSAIPPAHVHDDSSRSIPGPSHVPQAHTGQSRTALAPQYREAPMSTLNDVISRIKGALDDMHTKAEPQKPQKWLPPALRPKVNPPAEPLAKPTEVFDVTMTEPPRSPRPWNVFNVKVPQVSRPVEPVSHKRQYTPKYHSYVRWDIFSWDPPPEGFYRRDFSYNDLVFRRPQYFNRRPKYFVSLPRSRPILEVVPPATSSPIVNLPTKSPVSRPGKHNMQQLTVPTKVPSDANHTELDTVSRSPPPPAPSTSSNGASIPKAESVSTVDTSEKSSKPRSHQKMPAGSDVAFYRDSRIEVVTQPTVTVSFIVTSELEQDTNGVDQKSSTSPTLPPAQVASLVDNVLQERETESEAPKASISTVIAVGENGDEVNKSKNLVSILRVAVNVELDTRESYSWIGLLLHRHRPLPCHG